MTAKFLTIASAAALVMATAGPARAQAGGWLGARAAYANDDYRTSYAEAQRSAYDNGYRDGVKRGEEAARDRRGLDIQRERDYRDGDNGYNRSFGDRNRYRDNYRGGFAQGYRDAYTRGGFGSDRDRPGIGRGYPDANRGYGGGRYGSYGSNSGYGGFQNGVSDGYRKGLDDVEDRKYPDVSRQKWYRSGDHDYDRRYGSKDTYRIAYRRGFEEGYNRAYREARR